MTKKILIFGRGEYAQRIIRLVKYSTNYEIIGVTDSYVTCEEIGSYYEGIELRLYEKINTLHVDKVVVCSFRYTEEIIKQLKQDYSEIEYEFCTASEFLLQWIKEEMPSMIENDFFDFWANGVHRPINKWLHYFEIYDRYFSAYRNKPIVFLEIGVFKGGSLQMWKKYFGPQATIIGIDIDKECKKLEEDNIFIEIGSQGDAEFWKYIKEKYPKIDILLDDGGHEMSLQKTTFDCMFEHIQNNGIFMCEDTQTSYWEKFGGGYKEKSTFIEYSKSFIDDMHAFYSEVDSLKVGYNTLNIGGVHFHDGVVVVEKKEKKVRSFSMIKENGMEARLSCKVNV